MSPTDLEVDVIMMHLDRLAEVKSEDSVCVARAGESNYGN